MQAAPTTPQIPPRPDLRAEEYAALRATIRERGTTRVVLMVSTMVAWAALAASVHVWIDARWGALLPLLVLAAGFEAVFALHVGVERIGRFIQVVYEPDLADRTAGPAWEHTAMRFGQAPGAGPRVDPLFTVLFVTAVAVNWVPSGWNGGRGDVPAMILGAGHLIVVARMLRARSYAARQRGLDLAALVDPAEGLVSPKSK